LNWFLYRVRDKDLVQSSTCGYSVFLTPFVKETALSPIHVFASYVSNQMAVAVWVYFWNFDSIPLVHMSVFVPEPISFVAMAL
jgi:hypothetical protein